MFMNTIKIKHMSNKTMNNNIENNPMSTENNHKIMIIEIRLIIITYSYLSIINLLKKENKIETIRS